MEIDMDKDFSLEFKTVGLNISYYRKLRGLTQLQLADKINISRTHMSNIEAPNMHTSISLELLFTIADALNVEPYKLLKMPS
jgi:transcriptional regulator with XRE-family HTH domain